MKIKKFLIHFATMFALVLVVSAIVTYLWSLIFHGAGAIDWQLSFTLAIIVGIILAVERTRKSKEKP